jgi:hypothetical protein
VSKNPAVVVQDALAVMPLVALTQGVVPGTPMAPPEVCTDTEAVGVAAAADASSRQHPPTQKRLVRVLFSISFMALSHEFMYCAQSCDGQLQCA